MICRLARRRLLAATVAGLLGLAVPSPSPLGRAVAQDQEPPAPADPPPPAGDPPDPAGDLPDPAAEPEPAEPPTEPEMEAAPEFVPTGIPPASLAIPKLGVEARVVGVALDEDGAMAVPPDPDQVAWYTLAPGMGVPGNVIFAAHIDWGGRPRVFGRLAALDIGDVVLVVDAQNNGYEYVVESSRWVRAEGAPVEEIFAQTYDPTITLITCGGTYVAARREYLDRLIVRARGT